jgi:type II secretory pathway predicted ATPase ExeA
VRQQVGFIADQNGMLFFALVQAPHGIGDLAHQLPLLLNFDMDSSRYLTLLLVGQPLFDDTARQGMYQATKGIPRKVNKLAMTALRLAAASKAQTVNEAIVLDATAEAML